MLTFRRPILAAPLMPSDVEHTDANILAAMQQLKYPVLATLKKDGIRGLRLAGSLLSRTLKPIPNRSIRERSLIMPGGFDMELWNPTLRYDEIESIVMSREHPDSDKIQFHVLDWFLDDSYVGRLNKAWYAMVDFDITNIVFESPTLCTSPQALMERFLLLEREHGEGICFRLSNSPYKQGRSTLKEQYLVKLARYETAEAIIVGFDEQLYNGNRATISNLGLTERSSHKHRLVSKNTLGALVCRDTQLREIRIGTGFDDKLRQEIWDNQDKYLGKTIVYKCKRHGEKVKPRSPVFKGFRSAIDL